MRVLFASPVVPWPPESGGRMRTFNLLRALAGRAEVHLRAVLEPGQSPSAIEPLRPFCASALAFPRSRPGTMMRWTRARIERWFHSPSLESRLADEISSGAFDLVHLDELLLTRAVPLESRIPVVVHHHKLDTVLHEFLPAATRVHRRFDGWKLGRLEAEAARRFKHHIVCGRDDAAILQSRYPGLQVGVVESGFDPEYFAPPLDAPSRESARLVFVGSMNYVPNIDAVVWFAREIWPRILAAEPRATLQVVGAEPTPEILALADSTVRIEGLVADVRPYLSRAAALVIPLRIGGGTRLKLVEAIAMECPVVSTSIGAEGLEFEAGTHLAVADRPQAFADAVLAVLGDPNAARTRARAARAFAEQRYRWDQLAGRWLEHWRNAALSR